MVVFQLLAVSVQACNACAFLANACSFCAGSFSSLFFYCTLQICNYKLFILIRELVKPLVQDCLKSSSEFQYKIILKTFLNEQHIRLKVQKILLKLLLKIIFHQNDFNTINFSRKQYSSNQSQGISFNFLNILELVHKHS